MGQAFKVFRQRFRQLLLTDCPLLKHQLLHGDQAVAEVGDPDLQSGYPIVFGAALFNALRPLDAVIHQRRAQNVMDVLFQHGIDDVLNLDRFTRVVANLGIPVFQHLLEAGEVAFRQRVFLRQEHLTAGSIAATFQGGEHYAGEVDKAHPGTAIAPLAADGGFDAADGRVVVGILRFDAEFDEFRNNDFVVIKRRHPEAAANDLYAGVKEVITHTGVVAHAEVRLGGAQTAAGFENRIGERIHRILRVAVHQVLAADRHVLV